MTRTRDQFIDRYARHWAAMILFMQAGELKEGALARASRIYDMPAEVRDLLGRMWDENQPEATTAVVPATNGRK